VLAFTLLIIACTAPAPSAPGRPNIVLIALDTVRWDHTSLADYRHDTTPHLAALAAQPGATSFSMAFSDAAWSLPAYASLFTGRGVLSHGLGFLTMTLPAEEVTLAELLSAYGYQTHAWCSGPHLDAASGLSRGFDTYDHRVRAVSLARAASAGLEWLASEHTEDAPFFLFLQGYDAHYPYRSPTLIAERFAETPHPLESRCPSRLPEQACGRIPERGDRGRRLSDDERAHVIAHYDSAVSYADYQLGRILFGLSERGLLERTVVIVLSDHGEGLGEGDGIFNHDALIGDRVTHVPLVIRLPQSIPARRWDGIVSLSGLLPTLTDLLDLVPPAGIDGVAFSAALKPGTAPSGDELSRSASMCCYSVRTTEWALLGERSPAGIDWVLHARGVGGNVAADHPDVVAALSAAVADWPVDLGDIGALNQEPAQERPELKEALKEGGYWRP
jgi:arylsulfatase A-like enzyme